jgi:hypothetical protein
MPMPAARKVPEQRDVRLVEREQFLAEEEDIEQNQRADEPEIRDA